MTETIPADITLARALYDALTSALEPDAVAGDFVVGSWDDGGEPIPHRVLVDGHVDFLAFARAIMAHTARPRNQLTWKHKPENVSSYGCYIAYAPEIGIRYTVYDDRRGGWTWQAESTRPISENSPEGAMRDAQEDYEARSRPAPREE